MSDSSDLPQVADGHNDEPSTREMPPAKKRRRVTRPYPSISFQEALTLATEIQNMAGGRKVRRVSLLDHLGRSETSSTTRNWITGASKYGIIIGSYNSEYLELTPDGFKASSDTVSAREKAEAQVRLAILKIEPFKVLYERFKGDRLPAKAFIVDELTALDIDENLVNELSDLFLVNLQYVGLLKTIAGAERILTLDHLLEELPTSSAEVSDEAENDHHDHEVSVSAIGIISTESGFDNICFYVTPIGEPDSEIRMHSDLFLEHLVKPALEKAGLEVIRADKIDKPGIINSQIIEYLTKAKLVIADLSFANPNVLYELAIRHATRLPTVHLIRVGDKIPFDVGQSRIISIDCTTIYTLVPKLETYRAEIATQVRHALENPDTLNNPIAVFQPSFKVIF